VKRVLATLGLALASLTLTLLVLEGVVRLAVPHWYALVPQRFMAESTDGVLAGVPNFEGLLASLGPYFDVPVRLDARGFRNPPDADPAAPLVVYGDSFCFGWGVRAEETYPTLTASRLGVPYYNYCSVAADLLDDLHLVRKWKPADPNGTTILNITFENDVLAYPDPTEGVTQTAAVSGLSRQPLSIWLMNHSALFNVTTTLIRRNAAIVAFVRQLGLVSGVPVVAENRDTIAASVAMVERIRNAAGTRRFIVVTVPPRPGQVERVDYGAFVAALRAAGFEVLDPIGEGIDVTVLPTDGHWDAATHAAVADRLATRLAKPAS
jgi:hypothetical protein